METIVLEHRFEDRPFDLARYQEAQQRNEWCLQAHGVRHVRSYLTPDKRRMICIFEAPDAEAIRRLSTELGYEYEQVWKATVVD
jgi:uncharacterized protein with GYD domain